MWEELFKDEEDVFDSDGPPDFQSIVDKHLADSRNQWPVKNWYPSQITNFCPRFEIINRTVPVEYQSVWTPSISLLRRLDEGTWMHSGWQEKYLGPSGLLAGIWVCPECGKKEIGLYPEYYCHKAWEYEEVRVRIPITVDDEVVSYISGKMDGILKWDDKWYLVDIKTMIHDKWLGWDKIDKKHKEQIMIYQYGLEKGFANIDLPEGFKLEPPGVFGISTQNNSLKQMWFDYDQEVPLNIINNITYVEQALQEKVPIPPKECRRKSCAHWDLCSRIETIQDIKETFKEN